MKNNRSLIVQISDIKDLDKIKDDTKYLNLDITNLNHDIILYLKENGMNYLYSDKINNVLGYTYANYSDFIHAEEIIDLIYAKMPSNLSKLEIAKYLYVSLAKYVSFDINSDNEKNTMYNLNIISKVNNLWSSLAMGNISSKSVSKIYYYLCRRLLIDSDIVFNELNNEYQNTLIIDNQILKVDIFKDISYIKAKMKTRYFATYNEDIFLDKKIKYIKDKYNDYYLDKVLKNIDYTKNDCIKEILEKTQDIINVECITPNELRIIYDDIFNKYCPNYNIKINNLFLNSHGKFHFIMISCKDSHYSYNYRKKTFVKVDNNDIINNINIGKIGLYLNEYIPNINNY